MKVMIMERCDSSKIIKKTKGPLVTIVTPSFMQGRFIGECLESVRSQRYPFIQHLIFDCCSTDSTADVVRRYIGTYTIVFLQENDHGQAHAINKGLDMASGDIVCWLNSDDMFSGPDVVDFVVSIFQSRPDVDVVSGTANSIDESGRWLRRLGGFSDHSALAPAFLARRCVLTQPATFWKRNALRVDESLIYHFDWKLWIDMRANGLKFQPVEKTLASCRQHLAAKTVRDSAARRRETVLINKYGGARVWTVGWSRLIYVMYTLSESARIPFLKFVARRMNNLLARVSNHQIFSQ